MINQLPYSISYENSLGERVALDSLPFIVTQSEIFDSSWSFTTSPRPNSEGGRLISRRRSTNERTLTVQLAASSALELSEALQRLALVIEHDLQAMTPGRLWVNGLYLSCYIVSSEKTLSPDFPGMGQVKLSILPELPSWCSEQTYCIYVNDSNGNKYPYMYPYRYSSGRSSLDIFNRSGGPSPMRILFHGPAVNPRITVGRSQIGVDVTLTSSQYAVIDQLARRVYTVNHQGVQTNCFDKRVRGSCFAYLPTGSTVISAIDSPVDITVITMRSEPPWST